MRIQRSRELIVPDGSRFGRGRNVLPLPENQQTGAARGVDHRQAKKGNNTSMFTRFSPLRFTHPALNLPRGEDGIKDRMNKAEEAKIAQGGWSSLGLSFVYAVLFACGVHLGQIAAISDPWPDNMGALFLSAPFGGRAVTRLGLVYFLVFWLWHLSTRATFQSPAQFMATMQQWLMRMDRRHVAVIIGTFVFVLPLLMAAGMIVPLFLLGIGVFIIGGALLINMGTVGRALLGLACLAAGFLDFEDSARRSYDLDETCRPGARIVLMNGQNLACTSIQELGLYGGVLIRSETGSTFMPIAELEPKSVIEAVGPLGKFLF